MRDSVPSASYSSVCNELRQWNIPLIPTYRVYRLYDMMNTQVIHSGVYGINTAEIQMCITLSYIIQYNLSKTDLNTS